MLAGPVQRDLLQLKSHQFGDTQPAGETNMQHGAIPNTEARRQIWCVEDRPHLVHREVTHQGLIVALCRDGVDLPDLVQSGWHAELDVAHEGLDRRKSRIAGRRAVTTVLLDVGQEAEHQCGVDVFEAELRGLLLQTFAGKEEQQSKGVGVSLAGLRAVAPLDRHVFAEEGGDQGGDRCHGLFPPTIRASAAVAISVINSGVASKYQ